MAVPIKHHYTEAMGCSDATDLESVYRFSELRGIGRRGKMKLFLQIKNVSKTQHLLIPRHSDSPCVTLSDGTREAGGSV